jgi:hypothetical protein
MERFGPALRRVAAELDLPRRARTELLLELAADLDAVYGHHRARGVPEDEAARRAEATVLGSGEVIRRLGRLHGGSWRGWAEEVGPRLSGGLDLVVLAVGVLPVIGTAIGASVWVLVGRPSPSVLPILVVGALLLAVTGKEAVRLLRGRAPDRANLRTLVVLAAMAPALGLLAPVLGLRRALAGVEGVAPDQAELAAILAQEGATLLAGLVLGVVGLLAWLVLLELEARRGSREVDALLGESVLPLVRRRNG